MGVVGFLFAITTALVDNVTIRKERATGKSSPIIDLMAVDYL